MVYAGGWAINGYQKIFYINNIQSILDYGLELASLKVVQNNIDSILSVKNLNNYTIYGHNLGKFDSVFIINGASLNPNIKINPLVKDNAIISIKIKDSVRQVPGRLRDLLVTFECMVQKDYFPYKFVSENTLFYNGDKPTFDNYLIMAEYL